MHQDSVEILSEVNILHDGSLKEYWHFLNINMFNLNQAKKFLLGRHELFSEV